MQKQYTDAPIYALILHWNEKRLLGQYQATSDVLSISENPYLLSSPSLSLKEISAPNFSKILLRKIE